MLYPKKIQPNKKQKENSVKLAKDVLSRILVDRKITIKRGTYCVIYDLTEDIINENKNSLQRFLKSGKVKSCGVCALGSLFLSKVILKNEVDMDEGSKYRNYDKSKTFEVDYLKVVQDIDYEIGGLNAQLIESAFEKKMMERNLRDLKPLDDNDYDIFDRLTKKAANTFVSDNPRKRLYAICKNIIRNGGIFVPRGVTLEVWKK